MQYSRGRRDQGRPDIPRGKSSQETLLADDKDEKKISNKKSETLHVVPQQDLEIHSEKTKTIHNIITSVQYCRAKYILSELSGGALQE